MTIARWVVIAAIALLAPAAAQAAMSKVPGDVAAAIEQVMVRDGGAWREASFHNVVVNPGATAAPPR